MYDTSITLIGWLQQLIYEKLTISTPPAPFANDKYYGSKLSIYGARNKIRNASK